MKNNLRHERYIDIQNSMLQVFEAKNNDYGGSFFEVYERLGAVSALTQILHKVHRYEELAVRGTENKVADEKIQDTLLDMANYCMLTVLAMMEEEDKKPKIGTIDVDRITIGGDITPQIITDGTIKAGSFDPEVFSVPEPIHYQDGDGVNWVYEPETNKRYTLGDWNDKQMGIEKDTRPKTAIKKPKK